MSEFYTAEELFQLGATHVGEGVTVSRRACFYGFRGRIGARTRIDDGAIIKGDARIGRFVHISAYCVVGGSFSNPVILDDFSGLSTFCSVFTASDDYSASALSNPTVPIEKSCIIRGPVTIGLSVVVGSHSVILPNVSIGDGASIGAFSLVSRPVEAGAICVQSAGRLRSVGSRDVERIRCLAADALSSYEKDR